MVDSDFGELLEWWRFVAVSGPSGSGKTTLVNMLAASGCCQRAITHTTRAPRPGEVDGVDYHFVSSDEMRELIAIGEMLEYAELYDGSIYGLSCAAFRKAVSGDLPGVAILSVEGVLSLRRRFPELWSVWLMPSDVGELFRRMVDRGDTEASIQLRMDKVAAEGAAARDAGYTFIVYNDELDVAASQVCGILRTAVLRSGDV